MFPSRHWHRYLYASAIDSRPSHMAISLSGFHCACQRFEERTTKEGSPTIVLCERYYQSTECYCARNKGINERQREVEGDLEQLQRHVSNT